MDKRKSILIGCPQHEKLVRGTYLCDAAGSYCLGGDGEFLVQHVKCGHDDGRCSQTLCVLHRYNRQGPGAWYPSKLVAPPQQQSRPPASGPRNTGRPTSGEGTDILA